MKKKKKLLAELNDKDTLVNKLNTSNNEHEKKIRGLKKELNDKEMSLNVYKKRLATLNSTHGKKYKN